MTLLEQRHRNRVSDAAPAVLWLDDRAASARSVAGAKAANLSAAAVRGLPVVDGFVVTVGEVRGNRALPSDQVREAWARLSDDGAVPLVVRSSSPIEDLEHSSMAGMFTSVLDVHGWEQFADAYRQVVASAATADMAVLVQRQVRPGRGGVLFGIDPVSGRDDRMVIAAVMGGPDRLVSGEVQGRRVVVTSSGRVESTDGDEVPVLSRLQRRRLIRLARAARRLFGAPQDIEWAIDGGRVLLLQSRPVTSTAEPGTGPLLGQGPVAETFPGPLSTLEVDLWTPPLRDAITATLAITGSASRRRIAASPVLTIVDGYVVADLELIGLAAHRSRIVRAIDPRPPLRRLAAAWRVGRLRGALTELSFQVLDRVDAELAELPPLSTLDDDELLLILDNTGAHLRSVHGHEMLVGSLLEADGVSAGGVALSEIANGRSRGWSDEDIIARSPEVLALVTPTLGPRPPLPRVPDHPGEAPADIATREQLRLRVRWLHELTRQVARELGARLVARGVLVEVDDLGRLSRSELDAAVRGEPVTVPADPIPVRTPLPSRFRLSASGAVIGEASADGSGVGASTGRARGRVVHRDPAPDEVLVVHSLDPALAPVLGMVAAIVAETGSPLSHLAILAREREVPVVVGFENARDRLPEGTMVSVDGTTGDVELLDEAGADR